MMLRLRLQEISLALTLVIGYLEAVFARLRLLDSGLRVERASDDPSLIHFKNSHLIKS